ncbi:MAG TPA: hypothetical protein VE641_08795 [Chthoniobacterales bacterium]|jgi:hypothetical protein|nr:hypothetical protein [Chthoniobacterales bacterium]
MPKKSQTQLRDWWLSHCGWCHREIGDEEPRLAAGLKFSDPKDYRKNIGKVVEFKLASGRSVIASGVLPHSEARKEGKDLLVIVCSEECREAVSAAIYEDWRTGQ